MGCSLGREAAGITRETSSVTTEECLAFIFVIPEKRVLFRRQDGLSQRAFWIGPESVAQWASPRRGLRLQKAAIS